MTMIAGVSIGPGHPCRVIAEVSNNHNGSLALAKRLIREAAEAGVDFVKFQCFRPDELVALRGDGPAPDPWGSEGWTMRRLYDKAQTPHEWFPELVAECEAVSVPWFASVFGLDSLALLERLGCPAYKIAALDQTDAVPSMLVGHPFGTVGGPRIIASTHGSTRVRWADLTLQCPPGYPQEFGSGQAMTWAAFLVSLADGFSYHGTSVETVTRIANAGGASLIECHVQLDDVPSELEANVSLTISQLRELCGALRTVPA